MTWRPYVVTETKNKSLEAVYTWHISDVLNLIVNITHQTYPSYISEFLWQLRIEDNPIWVVNRLSQEMLPPGRHFKPMTQRKAPEHVNAILYSAYAICAFGKFLKCSENITADHELPQNNW